MAGLNPDRYNIGTELAQRTLKRRDTVGRLIRKAVEKEVSVRLFNNNS